MTDKTLPPLPEHDAKLLRLFDLYASNLLQGANAQAAATRDEFRAALAAAQPEAVAPAGWAIVDKRGCEQDTRFALRDFFGHPQQQDALTDERVKWFDGAFPGLAPHRLVTLYAAAPQAAEVRDQSISDDFELKLKQSFNAGRQFEADRLAARAAEKPEEAKTRDDRATWYSLVMNAAAALEDAAACLRDKDAGVSANGAAAYCRKRANELWQDAAQPEQAQQPQDAKDAARYRWLTEKLGTTQLPTLIERITNGYVADYKPSIDAAIDAAMSGIGTKEGGA